MEDQTGKKCRFRTQVWEPSTCFQWEKSRSMAGGSTSHKLLCGKCFWTPIFKIWSSNLSSGVSVRLAFGGSPPSAAQPNGRFAPLGKGLRAGSLAPCGQEQVQPQTGPVGLPRASHRIPAGQPHPRGWETHHRRQPCSPRSPAPGG